MPRSEAEVDAALADLEAERTRLRAALAALPSQETRLLDQDAGDDAFFNLDLQRRRNERALGRLDVKEAQLVRLGERYQIEAQQAAYAELRQRYVAASEAVADAASLVAQRIEAVNKLSLEADRRGFSIPQLPTLPRVGYSSAGGSVVFDGHLAALHGQVKIADATPKQVPQAAPRQKTYAVRFLKWTEMGQAAYQRGQIANFVGGDCEKLVARGRAEWMKPGMTFDPMAAMWGAGPAPDPKHQTPAPETDNR